MKAKYALMMVAFSLATFAQAQDGPQHEPKKTTDILESLSASPAISAISLEKRVEKMPSLAMIPADTTVCFSCMNLCETIVEAIKSPSLSSMISPLRVTEIIAPVSSVVWIKDIVVAGDARLGKSLMDATHLLSVFHEEICKCLVIEELSSALGYSESVSNAASTDSGTDLVKAGAAFLSKGELAPVLALVSMDIEMLAVCQESIFQEVYLLVEEAEGAVELYKGKHQGLDFTGVKLLGKNLADQLRHDKNIIPIDIDGIAKSMEKHDLYILFAFKDDKMIVSVCADPAAMMKIAATPKESILATDKLAFTDHVEKPMIVGYCDEAFYDALLKYQVDSSVASFKGYAEGVETAAQDGNIGDIAGALASWKRVGEDCIGLMKMGKGSHPVNMAIWWDNGFQMEMTQAGSGIFSSEKPLKLTSYSNQSDNIIYAAATISSASMGKGISIMEHSVSATWQFAERVLPLVIQNMEESDAQLRQIVQMMPLVQMCKPELVKIWGSAKLALSGMDNESILIVDAQGTAPQIPLDDPTAMEMLKKLQVPRFAYAKGVSDRSKIAAAWDQMTVSIEGLTSSLASPVEEEENAMSLGNPNRTDVKGISTYVYPSPFFTAECKPCLSISDKVFVFGSSPGLNQSIAEAMTAPQTGDLKGSAFALKIAPVSKMIQSYAKAASAFSLDKDMAEKVEAVVKALNYFDGIYGVITDGETMRMRLSIPIK